MKEYYLIDSSYFLFVVIYGAFAQYSEREYIDVQQMSPDFDPTLDTEFLFILNKRFDSLLKKTLKKVNEKPDLKNVIFALDCPRNDIWRRSIYPGYKLQRDLIDHTKDKFNFGKVITYAKSQLIPLFCANYNSHYVSCPCAEADDIIAILAKRLSSKHKVVIVSSDRDMVQLYNDRTTILTTQGIFRTPNDELKKLLKTDELKKSINANEFLLLKCIMGDPSDNITSIKKGIGIKRAYDLLLDKEKFKSVLQEENTVEILKRNKSLISMLDIPEDIENLILENVRESFTQ